jgi:uncharacterized DUF497 family protein
MPYGFDWDEVAAHGLTTGDAEAAFFASDAFGAPGKRGRYLVYGTVNGRFLCVVFTFSGETTIRVTTAYPTNPRRIKR